MDLVGGEVMEKKKERKGGGGGERSAQQMLCFSNEKRCIFGSIYDC